MDDEFQRFISYCKEQLPDSTKDLVKLIKKRYREADDDYIESDDFKTILEDTKENIEKDQRVFVHLRDFLNTLKDNKDKTHRHKGHQKQSYHSSDSEPAKKRFKADFNSDNQSGLESGEQSNHEFKVNFFGAGSSVSESESDVERKQTVTKLINGLGEDIEGTDDKDPENEKNGVDIPSDDDDGAKSDEGVKEQDADGRPEPNSEDDEFDKDDDDSDKKNKSNSDSFDKDKDVDDDDVAKDADYNEKGKTESDSEKLDLVSHRLTRSSSSDSDLPAFDCTFTPKRKIKQKTGSDDFRKMDEEVDSPSKDSASFEEIDRKDEDAEYKADTVKLRSEHSDLESEDDVTIIDNDKQEKDQYIESKENKYKCSNINTKTSNDDFSDDLKENKDVEKLKLQSRKRNFESSSLESSDSEVYRKISQKRRKKYVISVGKKSTSSPTSPKHLSPHKHQSCKSPKRKSPKKKSPNVVSPNKNIVIITDSESSSECDLSKATFYKKLDEKYGKDFIPALENNHRKIKTKDGKLKRRKSTKEKSEFKEIKKKAKSPVLTLLYSDDEKYVKKHTDSKFDVSLETNKYNAPDDLIKTEASSLSNNVDSRKRVALVTLKRIDTVAESSKKFVSRNEETKLSKDEAIRSDDEMMTNREPVNKNGEPEHIKDKATRSDPVAGTSKEPVHEEPKAGTSRGTEEPSTENDKKKKASSRQIRRLENLLQELNKKIEKVRSKELDLNDLDSEVSDYLYEDKLKRKFMKVWDKLCELHNAAKITGRHTDKYFRYQGTRYAEINKKIERLINRKKIFPDFHDIRNIIAHVNKEKRLHLRGRDMDDLAREAFTDVGNKLQSRRQKDLAQTFKAEDVNVYSSFDDPALYDPDLKKKLESNRKEGKSKMDQVVEKYCKLQMEVGDKSDNDDDEDDDEEEEEEEAEKVKIALEMDAVIMRTMVDNSDSDCDESSRKRVMRDSPCLEIENIEDGDKTSLDLDKDTDLEILDRYGPCKREDTFKAALGLQAVGPACGLSMKDETFESKPASKNSTVDISANVEDPIPIVLDSPDESADENSLKLQIHSPRHIDDTELHAGENTDVLSIKDSSLDLQIHSPKHISDSEHEKMKRTIDHDGDDGDVILIDEDEIHESIVKNSIFTTNRTHTITKPPSQESSSSSPCNKGISKDLVDGNKGLTKDKQDDKDANKSSTPYKKAGPKLNITNIEHVVIDPDIILLEEGDKLTENEDNEGFPVASDSEESDVLIPYIVKKPSEIKSSENSGNNGLGKSLRHSLIQKSESENVLDFDPGDKDKPTTLTTAAIDDVFKSNSGKHVPNEHDPESGSSKYQNPPLVIDDSSSCSSEILIKETDHPNMQSTAYGSCSQSSKKSSQGPNIKTTKRKQSHKNKETVEKDELHSEGTEMLDSQDVYNLETQLDDSIEMTDDILIATEVDTSKLQDDLEDEDILLASEKSGDGNGYEEANDEVDLEDEDKLLDNEMDTNSVDDMHLATETELEDSDQPHSVPDIFEDDFLPGDEDGNQTITDYGEAEIYGNQTITEISDPDKAGNLSTETVTGISDTDERRDVIIEIDQVVCSRTSQSPHVGDCEVLEETPYKTGYYQDNRDTAVDDDNHVEDHVTSLDGEENDISSTSIIDTGLVSSMADKLKLPEVKNKLDTLIKLEKAKSKKQTNDCKNESKHKKRAQPLWMEEDENADLITNYVEPDTSVLSSEEEEVSSSQDVIVLSD